MEETSSTTAFTSTIGMVELLSITEIICPDLVIEAEEIELFIF